MALLTEQDKIKIDELCRMQDEEASLSAQMKNILTRITALREDIKNRMAEFSILNMENDPNYIAYLRRAELSNLCDQHLNHEKQY